MSLHAALVAPFVDYGFMRRALLACVSLGLGAGPVGVLLMLRRMSLVGDAMSHAVLPGAAVGFLLAGGLSLPAMGLGGLIAGLGVALLSGLVSRTTRLKEDASFASFYLASLALGVLIASHLFTERSENVNIIYPPKGVADFVPEHIYIWLMPLTLVTCSIIPMHFLLKRFFGHAKPA